MPTDRSPFSFAALLRSLLTRPIEWACGLLMTALTVIVFLQVITRYVIAYPWEWPEELARILFVWLALLGAVLAFRKAGHFSIEVFVGLLPGPWRRGASMLVRLSLLGFLLLVASLGLSAAIRGRDQRSTAMEISMTFGYAAVPVSFLCMALEMGRAVWRDLRGAA